MKPLVYITLSSDEVIKNSFHQDILNSIEEYFSEIVIFCWGKRLNYQEGKRKYIRGNIFDWYRSIRELSSISLIYCNDYFLGGLLGTYLKKKYKAPLFLRIGSPWKYNLSSPITIAKLIIVKTLQPYIIKQSNLVVYNSKAVIYHKMKHEYKVIYNGIDTVLFHPLPVQNQGKNEERLRLLFVGNINEEKGLDYLFKAVEELGGKISLTLVGDGPLLKKYQRKYPFALFIGRKQHYELPKIINDHDILIHPSYVESLPNIILEAMACGKPVIAANVYGVPEVINNGENGLLVLEKDCEALKKAIITLHHNPILRMNIGDNAQKTVQQKFNQKKKVKLIREALLSLNKDRGDMKLTLNMVNTTNKDFIGNILDVTMTNLDHFCKNVASIHKDFILKKSLEKGRLNKDPNKKILAYWDFNQRVSKLGDFITFLEFLNVLRHEFNIADEGKNIDICFIDDPKHHNASRKKFAKTQQFKENIRSLAITNSNISTISCFHSNAEFQRFFHQNEERYIRWPPTASGSVFADWKTIDNFYKRRGFIPHPSLPPELIKDALQFYQCRVAPAKPIILNVRINHQNTARNSNLGEIQHFLKHYRDNKEYKFIIVCSSSEISAELRTLPHVLFSKDYFTEIEHDLALIQTSYLSIFPSSGMACLAWFGDFPFIQFGPHGYDKFTRLGPQSFAFFKGHQRYFENTPTASWLIAEFEKLVKYVEENKINNYRWGASL